jgi:transcriptional regulator with XRE-family HTH domain
MINVLGEKIKKLRKEKGLTLEGLAEQTGSSKSYIWELENKNPPRPSAEKVSRIAEALGVTSDFLIDENESTPTPAVLDEAFYRQYRRLPDPTKEKIRQMVEIWSKDE